ncbi:hypothetical protein THAOC_23265, partial [Thalassiosira oceanica]
MHSTAPGLDQGVTVLFGSRSCEAARAPNITGRRSQALAGLKYQPYQLAWIFVEIGSRESLYMRTCPEHNASTCVLAQSTTQCGNSPLCPRSPLSPRIERSLSRQFGSSSHPRRRAATSTVAHGGFLRSHPPTPAPATSPFWIHPKSGYWPPTDPMQTHSILSVPNNLESSFQTKKPGSRRDGAIRVAVVRSRPRPEYQGFQEISNPRSASRSEAEASSLAIITQRAP